MGLNVSSVEVWAASIPDAPGALAGKLEAISRAGASLEFLLARRAPERPGEGVVFTAPVEGKKQERVAREAGFDLVGSLHTVRVQGRDRPSLGARIARALAEAGLNLRGVSAASIGNKAVFYVALDSVEDAKTAVKVLKGLKTKKKS